MTPNFITLTVREDAGRGHETEQAGLRLMVGHIVSYRPLRHGAKGSWVITVEDRYTVAEPPERIDLLIGETDRLPPGGAEE